MPAAGRSPGFCAVRMPTRAGPGRPCSPCWRSQRCCTWPASLWVMELSARVFGLNYWSVLVPQALEGVATAGVLYATVRRWSGPAAGIIAAGVMATTPVAALMFRFNNPDALLVLLMVVAAYAMTRAIDS